MGDLEEKLNSILSNPEAMGQIMQLAHSLGGKQTDSVSDDSSAPHTESAPPQSNSEPFSALGELDPRLMELAFKLLRVYRSENDERAALLAALRPFLRPERYSRLDQAIQISKLTRIIRIALDSFQTKDGGGGHFDHIL